MFGCTTVNMVWNWLTLRVNTIISAYSHVLFCLPFFYSLWFWRHVECAFSVGWCSDWLCLGRCTSLCPFSTALILGFVCSIWAKFSNGDNNRVRPGERRRWVLAFYSASCMLLQASQLHLPASPCVCPHFTRVSSNVQWSTESVVLPTFHSPWFSFCLRLIAQYDSFYFLKLCSHTQASEIQNKTYPISILR